eukprot:m.322009 g.322009  ORF g.322009 m.322009 type:complete len:104 (-) comp27594_c5_seq1:60-371(-)
MNERDPPPFLEIFFFLQHGLLFHTRSDDSSNMGIAARSWSDTLDSVWFAAKRIVYYGYIPTVLYLGLTKSDPKPSLLGILLPAFMTGELQMAENMDDGSMPHV